MKYFLIFFLALILPNNVSNAETPQENQNILSCQKPLGYHIQYQTYECPIGSEKFTALSIGVNTRFGVHLDWSPVSYMRFPVPLAVCPSNGFIIDKREYTDQELEKIRQVITSDEYKNLYSEKHTSYYLYAKLSKMLRAKEVEQWWILLNATWEADICGDTEKYKKYALEVIEEAKVKLSSLSNEDYQYWQLNLIVPNLYRRVGEFEKANVWLENLGQETPDIQEDYKEKMDPEFFKLGMSLLKEAIKNQNKERVRIKIPRNNKLDEKAFEVFDLEK